jgi:hypothetical protein
MRKPGRSRACVLDDGGVGLVLKPAYRRRIDAEGSRHVHKRFAIRKPLDGFLALMLVKLARPAETHSTGLRTLPALVCASFDQVARKAPDARRGTPPLGD